MSNNNLGIILLSSVLTITTAPWVFSQSNQDHTRQPSMGSQRQTGFPSAKTQKGMTASQEQIRQAQQALKDQGTYSGDVDGKINSQFEQTLRDYQTQNNLQSTGKLNRQTMSKLGIVNGKDTTGTQKSGTGKSGASSKPGKGQQSQLQSKDEVRQVQTALQQKGFDPGPIDGIMGPNTRGAISSFQRQQNLAVSGNLDKQTQSALGLSGVEKSNEINSEESDREKPGVAAPTPNLEQPKQQPATPYPAHPEQKQKQPGEVTPDIGNSSSGESATGVGIVSSVEDMRQVQMALKKRGFDPGEINGMLSSDTQDAIRKFQSANNLPVTGNLDERTQVALGVTIKGTRKPDPFHGGAMNTVPSNTNRTSPDPETNDVAAMGPSALPSEAKSTKPVEGVNDKTGRMEHEYYERAQKAGQVLETLTQSSDNSIPESLLGCAEGIVVIPDMLKGAIGLGGRYGKGLIAERTSDGRWSAPAYISIGGGSFGVQLGLSSSDLVLIFTSKAALTTLQRGTALKLGLDAGVTAGPIGRNAEAGVSPNLESVIFAYSRSKGLFAGIALDGAVLEMDDHANNRVYGVNRDNNAILHSTDMAGNVNVRPFMDALNRVVPVKRTER